VSTIPSDSVAD